jgi:site-specific DNA-methyltransferase (adenine-specific)
MIKPYYEEPNITIYNGDCLEVMKELPDRSIDCVITSPPYDNLRTYEKFTFDFKNIAIELFRIIKRGGVLVWVVGDQTVNGSETGTSFKQALYFKETGFNLHDTMIYAKNNYVPLTHNRYEQAFEFMFVFSKNKPGIFKPIIEKSKYGGIKKLSTFRVKPTGEKKLSSYTAKENKIKCNIWFYDIGNNKTATDKYVFEHPAVFPKQLAKDHIISWSNPGDLVLDPFLGSGTTARACKDLGRKCIGIEISQKYCDIAIRRLAQEVFNFE